MKAEEAGPSLIPEDSEDMKKESKEPSEESLPDAEEQQ
jgi:hypothetical protein